MKKTTILIFVLLLCSAIVIADTGTYVLSKENVVLDIQPNTDVIITYDNVMAVTGGNIPWVTIGLPNDNFEVIESSGAVTNSRPQNQYGWTGVYQTLDKTYYNGDFFSFGVKVTQKAFVQKYNDTYAKVVFTPVWWDNAKIESMEIRMNTPPGVSSVITTTEPTTFGNNSVTWSYSNLRNGEKKTVGLLMSIDAFPELRASASAPASDSLSTDTSGVTQPAGGIPTAFWVIGGLVILFIIFGAAASGSHSYGGPSLSVGSHDKDFVRRLNMYCPNDNTLLNKRDRKDVTIDVCTICGGLFVDQGEIESLIKKDIDEKDLFTETEKPTESAYKKTPIDCLRCGGSVEKVTKTVDGESLAIYVCDDCGSIWMNKGIYQKIKDKRKQEEKDNKDKDPEDEDDDNILLYWWLFYPHIGATGSVSSAHFSGGSSGGGGSSGSYSSGAVTSCACVACACVACACACACAGGGAAGCAPKNNIEAHIFNKEGGI